MPQSAGVAGLPPDMPQSAGVAGLPDMPQSAAVAGLPDMPQSAAVAVLRPYTPGLHETTIMTAAVISLVMSGKGNYR